jgi:hypothetical protein
MFVRIVKNDLGNVQILFYCSMTLEGSTNLILQTISIQFGSDPWMR